MGWGCDRLIDSSVLCVVGVWGGEAECRCRTTRSRSGLRDEGPSNAASEEGVALPPEPLESNIESRRNVMGPKGIFLVGERARSMEGRGLSTARIREAPERSGSVELVRLKRKFSVALAPA